MPSKAPLNRSTQPSSAARVTKAPNGVPQCQDAEDDVEGDNQPEDDGDGEHPPLPRSPDSLREASAQTATGRRYRPTASSFLTIPSGDVPGSQAHRKPRLRTLSRPRHRPAIVLTVTGHGTGLCRAKRNSSSGCRGALPGATPMGSVFGRPSAGKRKRPGVETPSLFQIQYADRGERI